MTEAQIKEEVIRYLDDKSYNYAILIDGEWGSGKTFFVKHALSDAINEHEAIKSKRDIKYISLYGCKSMEDVQENIAWSFAENARKKILDSKKMGVTGDRIAGNALLASRKIGISILKKYVPDLSVYDIASDWLNLGTFIFIFDDLERCDCKLNEVFGFLNELVEHEGTKVIIVANEKEISGIADNQNIEQQYRIALEDKIAWPKVEQNNFYNIHNNANTISIEELERRRGSLFPDRDANAEYKKIREKLIGVILKYTPDVSQIMNEIIACSNYRENYKTLLQEKNDYFCSIMNRYEHHNLRSFQFFLSKVSYLLEQLGKINIEDEYVDKIRDHFISETFIQTVKFKANYHQMHDDRTGLQSEQDTKSSVIKKYVENGEFIFETFEKDVLILQRELAASIPEDDPYYLIYQQYYYHSQIWCEEQLDKMINRLSANKYPVSFYAKMIIAVQRLVDIGFDFGYLSQMKNIMLKNISDMGEIKPIDEDLWFCEDKDFANRIHEIVVEINTAIENHLTEVRHDNLSDILEKDDWIDRLDMYVNPEDSFYANDVVIFSKIDTNKWVQKIHAATPKEIDDFRIWLSRIYPRDRIRKSYKEDESTIKTIKTEICKLEEKDLIKKASLGWLDYQFGEIIKLNEPIDNVN